MQPINRRQASEAVAQLMPNVIRGVQLEFFIRRGVTQTQLLVLLAVHGYGGATMGTLARGLQVRMPTMTGIVQRLAKAGYVQRSSDPDDRRQVVVRLTAKGRAFIRQFQGLIRRRWEHVLQVLDPMELDAFYHVVTKLRTQLQTHTIH